VADKSSVTPRQIFWSVFALLAIAAGTGGWYLADRLYYQPLREQRQMVENLRGIVERLTKQTRIAEVAVVSQTDNPQRTTFKFVEVDAKLNPLHAPLEFTIDGDVAYFDTLAIKFQQSFVPLDEDRLKIKEVADLMPRASLILFRRVFGEKQKPEDGFPLDSPNETPAAYQSAAPPSEFEQKLWREFWQLANDPKLAESRGVYAAHGQAVYTQLQRGKTYLLERTLSGDLTIRPQALSAIQQPPTPAQ
jgi:hypothetical protein